MNPVKLRALALGQGRLKICVPLTGATAQTLLLETALAKAAGADLVEWRADYFDAVAEPVSVIDTVKKLRTALGETPLLFTFRTVREGGEKALDPESYIRLNTLLAASGSIDAVDVELFEGESAVSCVVQAAQKNGVSVVVSSHEFACTPSKAEIIARLKEMRRLGADIPKIAVMPATFADVLTLMSAVEAYTQTADCPVIAMAMGELGRISRVAGQWYGSALTFGSTGCASAPGQLAVEDLKTVLDIFE